ncbi:hypothetical protein RSSM_05205 [Rhodopirellula sallentina SM41]|uniref:Uncharacterized protein n=1 Tax=Rhodopirellula sallentina SM41 TaxID=1263870 RepID=M5TW02_9BACT|nr:hypothetical protein RSSM_05205 [Rhodopirellula sallentina SM41]
MTKSLPDILNSTPGLLADKPGSRAMSALKNRQRWLGIDRGISLFYCQLD